MMPPTHLPQARRPALRRAAMILAFAFSIALSPRATAQDWPEWRGKGRTGVWTEEGILDTFPEGGLNVKWRVPIKSGYAGPAVAGGRVFVSDFERGRGLQGTERAICLDSETGDILWDRAWPVDYTGLAPVYAIGARATPTVDGDRVYFQGAMGKLLCLNVSDGELLWEKDYVRDFGTQTPIWGMNGAPLVWGDLLICLTGGEPDAKVMAFDKLTGEVKWRALSSDYEPGYAQPLIARAGGVDQLILWEPRGLNGMNPATGEVYWTAPMEAKMGLTVATPIVENGRVFVTAFYNGSMLVELDAAKPAARTLWSRAGRSEQAQHTQALHSLVTTPLFRDGFIYGIDSYGELRCLDPATGERVWSTTDLTQEAARWSSALIVRQGDRYFANTDRGDLVIFRLSPRGYEEIDRTFLIQPTTGSGNRREMGAVNWSHPAYAGGHIFARNDLEIICAVLTAPDHKPRGGSAAAAHGSSR